MTFPSDKKKVSYRPYEVKEERVLLMAAESQDAREVALATRAVVNACILDKDFDCAKRPVFDLDYAFMTIRSKSIGEKVENDYTCENEHNGKRCGHPFKLAFDISQIEFVDPKEEPIVKIDDEYSVKMKYTPYQAVLNMQDDDSDYEKSIKTLMESIDCIFTKDEVFTFADVKAEDKRAFVEGLRIETFDKMKLFVENLPFFKLELKYKCEKCGYDHVMVYDDPTRFF